MKKTIILILIFIVMNVIFGIEIMKLEDIKAGMKGYAITVFKGFDIDTFDIEIIDIMKNYNADNSIILVKCIGENIEKTGIAMGMSGSPVYIDNKLIGALSYTWSSLKEPMGGVTPIEEMLNIKQFEKNNEDIYEFKKIYSPLILSDVEQSIIDKVKSKLPYWLANSIMSGKNYSIDMQGERKTIKPGSSVAVKLIEGDVSFAATGTCTYVENDDIFIFGHAFYTKGNISFPISLAYIYSILPRNDISVKMSGALKDNLATAVQDRYVGLYGIKNKKADMIDIELQLPDDKLKIRAVKDEDIVSSIIPLITIGIINNKYKSSGAMSIYYEMEIITNNNEKINYQNTVSSESALFEMYTDLQSILYVYLRNIYNSPDIKSIKITLDIDEYIKNIIINDIIIPKRYYYPGENIEGYILLKQFRGNTKKIPFSIDIPSNIKEDSLQLTVLSGRENIVFELSRNEGKYDFISVKGLENIIKELKPSNSIIVKLLSNEKGVSEYNQEYKTTKKLLKQMVLMGKKQTNANIVNEKTIFTNGVIIGNKTIKIKLRRQ